MTQAAKWFDPVIGIDVHMVMVPAPPSPIPVPTPLPHPFFGVVFDPLGAAIGAAIGMALAGGGPVLVNGLPAGNTGTDVLGLGHSPTPPGVSFAPNDIPGNDGVIITGSKTVTFGGASEGRLLSTVMSCNFPVNLPTSLCLAIPAGPPVIVGGPDSFDILAAVTKAIRTKWFSEALHKGLKPGPRLSKAICFLTGHPVDVMTGEVLSDAVDFEISGLIPIKFERNYWSRSQREGALGPGWSHPFDLSVDELGDDVCVVLPDGRERVHPRMAVGTSIWDDVDRYTFDRVEGGYRLTTWDGLSYHFERVAGARRAYPLVRITDRCDNRITLRYQAGRLAAVTDAVGRELRFSSTPEGRLAGVHFDAIKLDLVRFEYDGEGRLSSAMDAAGYALRYEYRGGVLVKETNRNGLSFYFEYDWYHPEGWCVRTWGDGGIYDRRITYDKLRHVTLVDDSRGGRTHYFGNAAGLVDRVIDATGRETRYEWDGCYRKTAEIDGLGNRTEWEYDQRGNVTVHRNALGQQQRHVYDTNNAPIETIDEAGHAWRRIFDRRGKPEIVVDPAGGTYQFEHDARGCMVAMTIPTGERSSLRLDDFCNVIEVRDWDGSSTRFSHDALGRLTRSVNPLGGETDFSWDVCGRLERVTGPGGFERSIAYDPEGNATSIGDELGRVTRYRYQGLAMRVEEVAPDGSIVRYSYDSEENLVAIVNEAGEEYKIDVDQCGRTIQERSFSGRSVEFRYDRAGRCSEVVSGRRRRARLERDALGRVVRHLCADGEKFEYEFDAQGNLRRATNTACDVVFERDVLGRVIAEQSGSVTVASTRDAFGRRVSRVTSTGHEARYDFDPQRRSTRISARTGDSLWTMTSVRDAMGGEVTRMLPGGLRSTSTRDAAGQPQTRKVARGDEVISSTSYAWRAAWQLDKYTDSNRGSTRYEHDAQSRLVKAIYADGTMQHRSFDAVGNVYRTPDHSDRRYGKGGALLTSNGVKYAYDPDGQLIEKMMPDGRHWTYSWDDGGQLRRVVRPDGKTVEFAYDALGRRVRKQIDGQAVTYLWDGDELVHELGPGKAITWIFDPFSDAPVARFEDDLRYGVLVDEVGLSPIVFDEAGQIAWQTQLDVYGASRGPDDAAKYPWRWAGQYEDAETGLFYNRFRYYDPQAGGFISQDPIGFEGGLRAYSYVKDPLVWIDELGLSGSCKAWIKRSLYKELPLLVGAADAKKFAAALTKGIVGPYGESGIKVLCPVVNKIYTHELKIGGSAQRILGYVDKNGIMLFDRFVRGGLH